MRIAHGPIMNIDHTRGSYLFFTIFPHVCPENREIGAAKIVSVKPIPAPNSTLKPPTKNDSLVHFGTVGTCKYSLFVRVLYSLIHSVPYYVLYTWWLTGCQ